MQLNQGRFISGGIEAKTLIEAGAAVVYSDADLDGYPETATVIVNTTVTDPAELAVYYPGEGADDGWEIRPLRSQVIVAGVATLVMWRHQLPLPELLEALVPEAIDGDDNANFLTTVDVYRHWNDPQQQVQFLWSPLPLWFADGIGGFASQGCDFCAGVGGLGGICPACQAATQWGCLLGRDYDQGIVHYSPAVWDPEQGAYQRSLWAGWRAPDRLRLWYYAGWQDQRQKLPTLQMEPSWARAVTYLALTLLTREMCNCNNLQALVRHWREDLALEDSSPTGSTRFQIDKRPLGNPFGTTRGAIFAWQNANRTGRSRGLAVRW